MHADHVCAALAESARGWRFRSRRAQLERRERETEAGKESTHA
jgi:hypothetical protein